MSIFVDDLRSVGAAHGLLVCEQAADEIEDLERAYALLYEENTKLQAELLGLKSVAGAAQAVGWSEHYDEVKATLQGAHSIMETVSKLERRVGPVGSHARGYTHKITDALRHLDALAATPAHDPTYET